MAAKQKLELIVLGKTFKYEGQEKNKERDLWELITRKAVPEDEIAGTVRANSISQCEGLSDEEIIGRYKQHVEAKAAKKSGKASTSRTPHRPSTSPEPSPSTTAASPSPLVPAAAPAATTAASQSPPPIPPTPGTAAPKGIEETKPPLVSESSSQAPPAPAAEQEAVQRKRSPVPRKEEVTKPTTVEPAKEESAAVVAPSKPASRVEQKPSTAAVRTSPPPTAPPPSTTSSGELDEEAQASLAEAVIALNAQSALLLSRFFEKDSAKTGALDRQQIAGVLTGIVPSLSSLGMDVMLEDVPHNTHKGGYDYVSLVGKISSSARELPSPSSSSTPPPPTAQPRGVGIAGASIALSAASALAAGGKKSSTAGEPNQQGAPPSSKAKETFRGFETKIQIFVQLEGTATNKLFLVPPSINYEELMVSVEKKFGLGTPISLSFMDGDDRIDVDDDEGLEAFFAVNEGKTRLKMLGKPAPGRSDTGSRQQQRAAPPPPPRKKSTTPPRQVDAGPNGERSTSRSVSPPQSVVKAGSMVTSTGSPQQVALPPRTAATFSTLPSRAKAFHLSAPVFCVALNPSATRFVCASRDRSISIWDIANETMMNMQKGLKGSALSCAFSPNDDEVIASSDLGEVKVWDSATGKLKLELKGHKNKVFCVKYNCDGEFRVSASSDKTVRVWSGKNSTPLVGHTDAVFCCDFGHTQQGRIVASGSADTTVRLWDWRAGKEVACFLGHTDAVWSVQFNSTDTRLVSAAMNRDILLWDVSRAQILQSFNGHMEAVHEAIFSPCDQYIISCSRDWCIMVWDVNSGRKVETLVGHRHTIYHLSMVGNKLASCSFDESVRLWTLDFNF